MKSFLKQFEELMTEDQEAAHCCGPAVAGIEDTGVLDIAATGRIGENFETARSHTGLLL